MPRGGTEDSNGKGWIVTMNMDMMLHAVDLPENLQPLAKQVRDTIWQHRRGSTATDPPTTSLTEPALVAGFFRRSFLIWANFPPVNPSLCGLCLCHTASH